MRFHRCVALLMLTLAACTSSRQVAESAQQAAVAAPPPPLFGDLGTHHHPVSCAAPAQRYFDQGLRLVYGFNHDEACVRSTRRADSTRIAPSTRPDRGSGVSPGKFARGGDVDERVCEAGTR
jgi:hypothetical protein